MSKEASPEDFAAMLAEFDQKGAGGPKGASRKRGRPELGEKVRGKIVSLGRESAFVSVGEGKAEATISLLELMDEAGKLKVKVGDEIEAVVANIDRADTVTLRRTFGRGGGSGPQKQSDLEQAFQLGVAIEGTVSAVNKGGVDVQVGGVRGFCPISQLELRHVEDANEYLGRKLLFKITRYEVDGRGANLVVSRRALLEEEGRARAIELRPKLVVGAVLPGVVSTLKDFGAFVDLGGIDGMLHVSELGHQRGVKPADLLAVGQPLTVQILKIEKTDDPKRPERISLSLKSLERDPFDDAQERFAPGTKVTGRVTRVEAFGAFVELAPGIEGLVHIGELAAGKQLRHARDVVKPEDTLEVTVLSLDRERRRISLGVGDHHDAVDAEGQAVARAASAGGMGTLGDLLKQASARKPRG